MPRFYCSTALTPGELLDLPASAARHVQVLRLQPGDSITLFNGGPGWDGAQTGQGQADGGEFEATITRMGRTEVQAQVGAYHAGQREAPRRVQLAVGMPANERMDWLVEKATELGVASIQPLTTERSVLRLSDERGEKKLAHWRGVAIAACEQCGGNRLPLIHPAKNLTQWLQDWQQPPGVQTAANFVLSLRSEAVGPCQALAAFEQELGQAAASINFLSGPEGGLSAVEEEAALRCGFQPVSLGQRVLRAETAALCALAALLVG